MDYKKLVKFMAHEVDEYNKVAFGKDLNAINKADVRLDAIREMIDKLEDGTSIAITWRTTDPLHPSSTPVTYIKECAVYHMDIWGKKHVVKCDLQKAGA